MTNSVGKKCVLVIDDEPDIGFLMRMMLESEGFCVDYVDNLAGASQLLAKKQFDTIFLDLNLNGELGLDLVPEIKLSSYKTVIAVITAQKEPEVRKRVRESGIDILIEKPFNRKIILEALK